MKNFLKISLALFILSVFVACGNGKVGENNQNESKAGQSNKEESSEAAEFRNVEITYDKEADEIQLQGEAISTNGSVYYKIEQLGEDLTTEAKVELQDERKWEDIELSIPVSQLKDEEEAVIFILYTKDDEGIEVTPNHFPANLIQMREYE